MDISLLHQNLKEKVTLKKKFQKGQLIRQEVCTNVLEMFQVELDGEELPK